MFQFVLLVILALPSGEVKQLEKNYGDKVSDCVTQAASINAQIETKQGAGFAVCTVHGVSV